MKRKAKCRIAPEHAGRTVLAFLSLRFTYHTPGEWKELCEDGRVFRNALPSGPKDILRPGDVVEYIDFDRKEPPVEIDYSILYEDAYLLVINKPGNLPCHPGGRYFENTLWSLLKKNHSAEFLAFVNRIDRETSGIVMVAKTPAAVSACRKQFEKNRVHKRYIVGVEGVFPPKVVCSSGYLVRDETSQVRKKKKFVSAEATPVAFNNAQACKTSFLSLSCHSGISLVAAKPISGRTHQIRATLCTIGYPVVGDKLYGVDDIMFLRFIEDRLDEGDRRKLRLDRQALHAASLLMTHPNTARPIHFKAPLPLDIASLLT